MNIVYPMKQLLWKCRQETQNYVLIITTNNFQFLFILYADFECFTKPMSTCSSNPEDSYKYNYQKHEPSGFCLYIKGLDPKITFKPILYTKTNSTDDISAIFVSKLAKVTIFFLYVEDELRAVALSPINQLLLQPRTLRYTSPK